MMILQHTQPFQKYETEFITYPPALQTGNYMAPK
jgi:hypothetical protein